MINKSCITKYFENLKNHDGIDSKCELNWAFYFSHSEKDLLESVKVHLILKGYDFSEVIYCDNLYYLQIAKNEIHTEDSLLKRCIELFDFSKKFGINTFEGFDAQIV